MINTVIFDMDGVLIDSEPFWQQAEVDVFKTVGLHLTTQDTEQSIGMRIDRVVEYWYERSPWATPPSMADITRAILEQVIEQVHTQGQAKAGVHALLDFFKTQGVKLAIASSSHLVLIEAVIRRLQIEDYFDCLWSAEFEPYGKPHPGVYLTTAQKLHVEPHRCLVIEDSLRGIISAKAAEMVCVAVPDRSFQDDARLSIADAILPSLEAFDSAVWERLNP